MRETKFIEQNRQKWEQLEVLLMQDKKDPQKLNDLFIQITDDLSYSRTFYPNRSVRVYLNGLAQKIFYSIYKNKRSRGHRLLSFWKEELPLLIYESRVAFRISFAVFILAMLIGVVSSIYDPDFCRAILGDRYVDMTLENIQNDDPMAVYKSKGKFSMSLGITINNIYVSFMTFLLGVFAAIGSIGILISNGVMVGAFQYFFYEHGLLAESALTIWMHGTLEISAIIIAGAAGITMGRGLIFPGTLSRGQAFQISARRGLKIAIGLMPIFILAGAIEGFLTRMTEIPDAVRLTFILACLAFVILYFVLLPLRLGRKIKRAFDAGIEDLQPSENIKVETQAIKKMGQLFTDTFTLVRKHSGKIIGSSALGATIYIALVYSLGRGTAAEIFPTSPMYFSALESVGQLFVNPNIPLLSLVILLNMTIVAMPVLRLTKIELGEYEKLSSQALLGVLFKVLLVLALLVLIFNVGMWPIIFLLLFIAPFIFTFLYQSSLSAQSIFKDLGSTNTFASGDYGSGFSLNFLFALLTLLFIGIVGSAIGSFLLDFLTWNLSFEAATKEAVVTGFTFFLFVFIFNFSLSMFIIGGGLSHNSLKELNNAEHLLSRVEKIGVEQRIRGLLKEKVSNE